jgi:hypothetical protein
MWAYGSLYGQQILWTYVSLDWQQASAGTIHAIDTIFESLLERARESTLESMLESNLVVRFILLEAFYREKLWPDGSFGQTEASFVKV